MVGVLILGALMLETLEGGPVVLENYGDREATVLVYLSSRCAVTDEAVERMNKAYERQRHDGLLFIGLIGNAEETAEEVRTFCQHRGVRFPVYRDPKRTVAAKLGATASLQAYMADSEGKVIFSGGFSTKDSAKVFAKAISNYLRKKALPEAVADEGATALEKLGATRTVEDPYGQPLFRSGLVFEKLAGAPAHHCSTLAECPNGDLICVWYGGSYESADDQKLFLSRKAKGAAAWGATEVLVDSDFPTPPGNAVVFRLGERIGLIWGRMEAKRPLSRGSGWESCRLLIRWSSDDGQTWSADTELEGLAGCLPRNAPFTLRDGRFAVPLSGHGGAIGGAFLLISDDMGATWTPSGTMEEGSQPTVIEREDGSLLALLRFQPEVLQSISTDGGASWTKPEASALRCPEAAIAMTKLKNGHLVLVYNDSTMARTPLSISRSLDDGKTWEKPLALETNLGEYSYPCVIQSEDGRIQISYTWRRYGIMHVELNEDWFAQSDRPN